MTIKDIMMAEPETDFILVKRSSKGQNPLDNLKCYYRDTDNKSVGIDLVALSMLLKKMLVEEGNMSWQECNKLIDWLLDSVIVPAQKRNTCVAIDIVRIVGAE